MNTYGAFAQRFNNNNKQDKAQLIPNNAGYPVYEISALEQLQRFLVLGTASNTYYVHRNTLLQENVDNIKTLFDSTQYREALSLIKTISISGRAPKVSPTLFALALAFAAKSEATRKLAADIFPEIVRTQSHLFEFISYVRTLRGMGRILRNAIRYWYQNQPTEALAYQMVKYRNRNGYTTRDVLRLVKPKPRNEERSELYAFGADKHRPTRIKIIEAFKRAQSSTEVTLDLIKELSLPREALPTEWLNNPDVWRAMLPTMPLTAMIRNLGKMASLELLTPMSAESSIVIEKLNDQQLLTSSRIHPFNVLLAWSTYSSGNGIKGSLTWKVNPMISTALEQAFYKTFGNVTPAGKRTLIGLDVSGSMEQTIMGSHISAATAAAALTLLAVKTEPLCLVKAFSTQLVPLNLDASDNLTTIRAKTKMPFGGTDCAAPILWAQKNNVPIDTFIIITDNETWAGHISPVLALKQYRAKLGIQAKLIVVGLTATRFSIADPLDLDMMDVVGFDAAVPDIINSFSKGL